MVSFAVFAAVLVFHVLVLVLLLLFVVVVQISPQAFFFVDVAPVYKVRCFALIWT